MRQFSTARCHATSGVTLSTGPWTLGGLYFTSEVEGFASDEDEMQAQAAMRRGRYPNSGQQS